MDDELFGKEYFKARLDMIDAANSAILRRQDALAWLIAAYTSEDTEMTKKGLDMMNKAMDKYGAEVKKIAERYNYGGD